MRRRWSGSIGCATGRVGNVIGLYCGEPPTSVSLTIAEPPTEKFAIRSYTAHTATTARGP